MEAGGPQNVGAVRVIPSQQSAAAEAEEGAPALAVHGGATADQEGTELHQAAHRVRALRPPGAYCVPLWLSLARSQSHKDIAVKRGLMGGHFDELLGSSYQLLPFKLGMAEEATTFLFLLP